MTHPSRGIDTSLGQAGFCDHCQRWNPEGPDICLGYLDGVSHACCGHGDPVRAYVVIGGAPDQPTYTIAHPEVLRGALALQYFGEKVPA